MSDNEDLTATGCIAALVALPVCIVLRGWVLKMLWAWFVVEQFALPELSIAGAYGPALIATLLVPTPTGSSDIWRSIVAALVLPLLFLALGWVVALWL